MKRTLRARPVPERGRNLLTVGEKWSRRWFIQRSSRVRYLPATPRSSPPACGVCCRSPSGSALSRRSRRMEAERREAKRARDPIVSG
jgi:hypothetical protein